MSNPEIPRTKVAFSGAGGVGKTTLIRAFQRMHLPGYAFVGETARQHFIDNPDTDALSLSTQLRMQSLALAAEQAAEARPHNVLMCDRSVLDAVAYAQTFASRREVARIMKRVADWLPTYDRIFLLSPIGVPFEADGVRHGDKDFRDKLHEAFLDVFNTNDFPYVLLEGSVPERQSAVMLSLGQLSLEGAAS